MPVTTNSKDALYIQSLIKESISLIDQLASMDKKIEKDILASKGALAVWWEKNVENDAVASFAADRIKGQIPSPSEEALKFIFQNLFNKTLKYSKLFVGVSVSAVLAPAESSRQPSYKAAYLDSQFGNDYYDKTSRLQEIYDELFRMQPPSAASILQSDRCAKEACWRAN